MQFWGFEHLGYIYILYIYILYIYIYRYIGISNLFPLPNLNVNFYTDELHMATWRKQNGEAEQGIFHHRTGSP